jgi:hypothetical protein
MRNEPFGAFEMNEAAKPQNIYQTGFYSSEEVMLFTKN